MNISKKFLSEVNELSYSKLFEFWDMHFMKCDGYRLTKKEAVNDLYNMFVERCEDENTQDALQLLVELADLQMEGD